MPTVLRVGPYRFFFFAGDGSEPQHVHVERDDELAKFWLSPVRLCSSAGFSRRELGKVGQLVIKHQAVLMEAWDEYFHG
jgi:hypothetical protein